MTAQVVSLQMNIYMCFDIKTIESKHLIVVWDIDDESVKSLWASTTILHGLVLVDFDAPFCSKHYMYTCIYENIKV